MLDTDDDIRRLARDGRMIEAIKLYRRRTGLGLVEAKAAVEALRDGGPTIQVPPPTLVADDPVLVADVEGFLRNGDRIGAIKAYRRRTGADLRTAKDAVERIRAERGIVVTPRSWWSRFFS